MNESVDFIISFSLAAKSSGPIGIENRPKLNGLMQMVAIGKSFCRVKMYNYPIRWLLILKPNSFVMPTQGVNRLNASILIQKYNVQLRLIALIPSELLSPAIKYIGLIGFRKVFAFTLKLFYSFLY